MRGLVSEGKKKPYMSNFNALKAALVVLVSDDKNGIIPGMATIGRCRTNVFAQHSTGTTEITRCEKGGCRRVMNVNTTEKIGTILGQWPTVWISIGVVEEVEESTERICELGGPNGLSDVWEITRVTRFLTYIKNH
jgi:hypothetical protein